MPEDILVVCVKVGTKYGSEYVNRLAAGVAKHITLPHRFLCLTDNRIGLDCDAAPIATGLPGWWSKLILFRPHPSLAGHRVVFMDLDTVLVGDCNFLLEYDGPFAILQDFYRAKGYGSAIMSIAPKFGAAIWYNFKPTIMQQYHGDQDWIQVQVDKADRWQVMHPNKIVSYKVHCMHRELPADARLVCFHGEPRPHEVMDPWMQQHWLQAGAPCGC